MTLAQVSLGEAMDGGLNPEQLNAWRRDGYLIIKDALNAETVSNLLCEANTMLEDFSLSDHPMTKFSTGEGANNHVGDDYFLTSGDKIRFFFEEDAFDTNGNLVKAKERAINKIGHYLHELSPPFRKVSLSKRTAAVARSLGFEDPRLLQSMVICKQPEIGGRVPTHQDSTFLYTNPPSAVGFWYALEDATLENGCLSFAKGSHRHAPVKQRFVRLGQDEGTGFEDLKTASHPLSGGETDDDLRMDAADLADEDYEPGEVSAGSLVLIHGNLLHKSEKNTSGKSRFIYTFHLIEGKNEYDSRNWLQPPAQGFSKVYPPQST